MTDNIPGNLERSFEGEKVKKVGDDRVGVVVKSDNLKQAKRNARLRKKDKQQRLSFEYQGRRIPYVINYDNIVAVDWSNENEREKLGWWNKKVLKLVEEE